MMHNKTFQKYFSGTWKVFRFDEVKDYYAYEKSMSPSSITDIQSLDLLKLAI